MRESKRRKLTPAAGQGRTRAAPRVARAGRSVWPALLLAVAGLAASCGPTKMVCSPLAQELANRQEANEQSMAFYREAMDCYQAARLDRARELLQQSVAADDRNAYAWTALGVVEQRRDCSYEAAAAFHRAARLEPTRYEPHLNIGTILETAGCYSQAAEEYELALRLAPEQVEVMENLARCYIRSRTKLSRARELVGKARLVEQRPQWRLWLEQQNRWLEMKKDYAESDP